MSVDVWAFLAPKNKSEGWRCRWCRGCVYLCSVGGYGCCNYFLRTQTRRGNPFGAENCKRRKLAADFQMPDDHADYCNGEPPREYILTEQMRKKLLERREKAAGRMVKRAPVSNESESERKKRCAHGKKASWNVAYAWGLYCKGYYIYEIAEIIGMSYKSMMEYTGRNKWKEKAPPGTVFERHYDIEKRRAEYLALTDNTTEEKPK